MIHQGEGVVWTDALACLHERSIGPSDFGIFDTFEAEAGRQAHLSGKVAEALLSKAPELFVGPPDIRPIDVLASK